jgi:hypothetical protein
MKLFKCQHCGQLLYFENNTCEKCGHRLGYISETAVLSALEPEDATAWQALTKSGKRYRFCANAQFDVCNWLIEASSADTYCAACQHNRTVPDTSIQDNLIAWRKIEAAKHRLFYSLMKLGLPLENPKSGERLTFDFLASPSQSPRVMTGHENGLITVAVEEADDPERERRRAAMHEPYRTLLGHFRHEVGHFYWDVLVRDGDQLEACRKVFGDDTLDYAQALQQHYANGAPPNWRDNFVSSYASSHPWEDFAETWAHYLHVIDTLEMARAFGMHIHPRLAKRGELESEVDFDPYRAGEISVLIDAWIPLSNALNSLSRTMGQPDIYPFVLSPPAIEKMGVIHGLIHRNKMATADPIPAAPPMAPTNPTPHAIAPDPERSRPIQSASEQSRGLYSRFTRWRERA